PRHAPPRVDDALGAPPRPHVMGSSWLMKRVARLAMVAAIPATVAVASVLAWNRVVEFLNGGWPLWVGNVANVLQIAGAIAALSWALTTAARSRSTTSTEGAAPRVLRCLALLLPSRDRERFVGE